MWTEPEYLCFDCIIKYRSDKKIKIARGPLPQESTICDGCGKEAKGTLFPLYFVDYLF